MRTSVPITHYTLSDRTLSQVQNSGTLGRLSPRNVKDISFGKVNKRNLQSTCTLHIFFHDIFIFFFLSSTLFVSYSRHGNSSIFTWSIQLAVHDDWIISFQTKALDRVLLERLTSRHGETRRHRVTHVHPVRQRSANWRAQAAWSRLQLPLRCPAVSRLQSRRESRVDSTRWARRPTLPVDFQVAESRLRWLS